MDSRLKKESEDNFYINGTGSFLEGFEFAIQRIRENKFYGYQGQLLADWLEKHLNQEVTSDRSKDK